MGRLQSILIHLACPALAGEIVALCERLNAAGVETDAPSAAYAIVHNVEVAHADWSGAAKRELASQMLAHHIKRNGGIPKASLVRVLVELAVERVKVEQAGYVDAYERIAAAWHATFQRLSEQRGWDTSGRAWADMPASYRVVMTETAERLVQDTVIARVWWR